VSMHAKGLMVAGLSRAFEDITEVMVMVKDRIGE
jgi:hypothetical protein